MCQCIQEQQQDLPRAEALIPRMKNLRVVITFLASSGKNKTYYIKGKGLKALKSIKDEEKERGEETGGGEERNERNT
jgi:hypothetical protein